MSKMTKEPEKAITKKTESMRKKTKKNRTPMIVLIILLCLLAIMAVAAVAVWNHTKPDPMSGQTPDFENTVEETTEEWTEEEGEDETIDPDAPTVDEDLVKETLPTVEEVEIPKDAGWTHYLLLGIDKASYKSGHSDAMVVVSINQDKQRLVLSSVVRDTYVYIDGKGFDKLTHAYQYGGADLTVKTFEENFDIDIANYFVVNFQSLPEIVDTIGGITLTLTDAEAFHMGEQYAAWGLSGGTQVLNGKEVLAYCRVRRIDSDYYRVQRQYKALMAIYEEVKGLSYDKYISLAKVAYNNMYSDMTVGNMLLLVKDVMEIAGTAGIEKADLVGRGNSGTASLYSERTGKYHSFVVVDDLVEVATGWREALGIESYTPSERIKQISEQLDKVLNR